jgi:uncharacterized phiE125 gp8 family phage protein
MGLTRTVDPVALPVSLVDAKKQCELGDSDTTHDDHIIRLIRAATDDVERHTRRALITQTWRLSLREIPYRLPYSKSNYGRIYLPRPPLVEVESVQYRDDNGVLQTLDSSLYQVTIDASPGHIEPAFNEVWPVIRTQTAEAFSVTYTAGFGDSCRDVPAQYQNVIFEMVAFRFMNRGDVQMGIPKHIKWSLDSLRCGAQYDYYGVKG